MCYLGFCAQAAVVHWQTQDREATIYNLNLKYILIFNYKFV